MTNWIIFDGDKVSPSKVVCVGRNYVEHIKELDNEVPEQPVIFIKPNSSISDEIYVHETDEIHYEGEISLLIENGCIRGVGFGLDLTKRKIQSELKGKGLPWERAKAFNRSAVFSDFVKIGEEVSHLRIVLHINGVLKQASGCKFMINTPAALLQEISTFMTLDDGDVVMTGTPQGVGEIHDGDTFTGKIFNGDESLLERTWLVRKYNK